MPLNKTYLHILHEENQIRNFLKYMLLLFPSSLKRHIFYAVSNMFFSVNISICTLQRNLKNHLTFEFIRSEYHDICFKKAKIYSR